MTNSVLFRLGSGYLIFLVLVALLVIAPRVARARPVEDSSLAPLKQSVSSELWQLGFTVEGSEPPYNDIIGRVLDKAAFRSYRDTDIYYIFPAPANLPIIKSVQFKISNRTGSYDGDVALALEILESGTGALRRTVSTANDGWETTGGSWTSMTLFGTDLQIAPDEFLAFHFYLSGAKGGDLDVRPEFEVEVQLPETATAVWRSGFTVEGTSTYEAITGRLAGVTAAFRSNRGVSDIYYIFPAPTNLPTIQSAKLNVISRTGSYAGETSLTLKIYNYEGTASRTISAASIDDLETTPTGTWTTMALSGTTTALALSNGEFLAARVEFGEGPANDLDVRVLFEVEVASEYSSLLYIPLILKQ